jgi:hypothetical protein
MLRHVLSIETLRIICLKYKQKKIIQKFLKLFLQTNIRKEGMHVAYSALKDYSLVNKNIHWMGGG